MLYDNIIAYNLFSMIWECAHSLIILFFFLEMLANTTLILLNEAFWINHSTFHKHLKSKYRCIKYSLFSLYLCSLNAGI